ncbi:hypothetical protein GIB67_031145 [Kingdonia uniflora]|uniref:Uncharacterized protein n=1 Tax=Kingdonia uniflora TaxID=39325 RepID=A0A7J7LD81_9MAGN|nr:hypothetical protein GIB67_031145 [Kingdonia uniflora]
MSKVDSIVEACNDTLSLGVTQTSIEQCQNHVEERSLESFKRRKLSESTLSLDNPCQVFSCLGLFSDEKNLIEDISYQFRAKVMGRGKDFVHSLDWEQGSNPLEARVSAARQMLINLRSIESQASKFPLLTSCTSKGYERVDCKGIMNQAGDFKIYGFDLRDALVGRTVAYELQKLYKDMEFDKIYPNGQLLNDLIAAFAKVRDPDRAIVFLAIVQGQRLSEDRDTGGGGIYVGECGEDC